MDLALFYNVDTDLLQQSATDTLPVTGLLFLRGNPVAATLRFCDNSGVVVDPGELTATFCAKLKDQFGQNPPLLLVTDWVKSGSATSAAWAVDFVVASSAITSALSLGTNCANRNGLKAMFSLTYAVVGEDPAQSAGVLGDIKNDVYQGTEAAPWPSVSPSAFIPVNAITGLTGGGGTNLDGFVSNGVVSVGTWFVLNVADPITAVVRPQFWRLESSNEVTNPALGWVRDASYDAATWPYVWHLLN